MSKNELNPQRERESTESNREYWWGQYTQAQSNWVRHMNIEHGGYPVNACHTCKGWKGMVDSAQSEYNRLSSL